VGGVGRGLADHRLPCRALHRSPLSAQRPAASLLVRDTYLQPRSGPGGGHLAQGGTAVALHIGHRKSIDFDLFTKDPEYDFNAAKLKRRFIRYAIMDKIIADEDIEFTFTANDTKITFLNFGYRVPFTEKLDSYVSMPSLLSLAAMKAFALGHRAKWKDYVDMYFIMRDHHSLGEIVTQAKKLFGVEFNEKLLRTQLAYFEDVNYSEKVIYLPGFAVDDEVVKKALIEFSLE